jgi:pterin 4 alpha carbinolamine dehydratase
LQLDLPREATTLDEEWTEGAERHGRADEGGKVSKQEIAAGLCKPDGWSVVKGNLHRVFEFKDFTQAFGFMKRVDDSGAPPESRHSRS